MTEEAEKIYYFIYKFRGAMAEQYDIATSLYRAMTKHHPLLLHQQNLRESTL
jgi:hypothetical protein